MIDVSNYDSYKIEMIKERLNVLKMTHIKVAEWLSVREELLTIQKKNKNVSEDLLIFKLRQEYIAILENKKEELEKDQYVIQYIKISSRLETILNEIYEQMGLLRRNAPEINSWIALNKKKSYYEEKVYSDKSSKYFYEQLEDTKVTISRFREMYADSISKWEKLYTAKMLIRSIIF